MTVAVASKEAYRQLMAERGVGPTEAARLLHVSIHTVRAWSKPDTSKGANPVPMWALELLDLKTRGRALPEK